MQVCCDFDGTISVVDTTDLVLERLAHPSWEDLEAAWLAGRIDAAACMRGQIALIGGSQADLDAVLDEVELAPGFSAFVAWCEARGHAVTVMSDGVDRFIRHVLRRHGLGRLRVVANRLTGGPGAWRLDQPNARDGCAAGAGVCKCEAVRIARQGGPRRLVYVGDGRSDFCVSEKADVLFAKSALAARARARGQAYLPFDDFHDVRASLERLLTPTAAT